MVATSSSEILALFYKTTWHLQTLQSSRKHSCFIFSRFCIL